MRQAAPSLIICLVVLASLPSTAWSLPCRGADPSWPQQYAAATGPYCVQLSDSITLQYAPSGDSVLFDVEALLPAATAYFGLGLSELGSMKGADMAILHNTQASDDDTASAGSSSNSSNSAIGWRLIDSYAPGFVEPEADAQQDVRLVSLSYSASNGTLRAAWVRSLVPCDTAQDLPLAVGMPVHIIWAYSSDWGYHGRNRGGKLIKFATNSTSTDSAGPGNASHATDIRSAGAGGPAGNSSGSSSTGKPALLVAADAQTGADNTDSRSSNASVAGSDVRVLDLTFPVQIPAQETTYKVMYFKLPDDRRYHIIKYEPVVNHRMLHHGVAYACLPSDEPKVEALPNMGPYNRLKQGMLCEQFFMMLASNMTPWEAPSVAALPFGANSTRYLALELHYNNPEQLQGQNDTGSGIRVYYTPKLREHDVGVLTLGQMVFDIPPGLQRYPLNASICPAYCTSRFRQPVQLLSGFFHMHDLGKEIIARHFRDGRELTPLGHLRNFDYAYQNNQDIFAPDAKVLLPGDSLSVQCIYNSTTRVNITHSGAGTRDEMCFYWVSYWPAQEDMGYCLSFGGSKIAACGADVKTQTTFEAFRNPAMFANLTAQGLLLRFPGNPAVNSTPYAQQCSNISATR